MKELWRNRQELIERALRDELAKTDILDNTLREAMEYSLMAGGKRLRPILLMAAADAVGSDGTKLLPAACALEMIRKADKSQGLRRWHRDSCGGCTSYARLYSTSPSKGCSRCIAAARSR